MHDFFSLSFVSFSFVWVVLFGGSGEKEML